MSLFAGIAALTLLAGCGESEPPPVNITTVEIDNGTNVTVPGDNDAEPAANATVVANAVEAAPALALSPDGLTIVLDSGSTRHANFGMARDVVVPMVSASLGKPTGTGQNGECGQGPMEMVDFKGGLSMQFQDGKFVGWDVDGREKGGYATMNGIGVGSTLKELRGSFSGVTVETSSLGDEFAAGELGGLLTSLKPDATITHLWAGSTCQFR
jgi:major membrane immunogen (membrane-anchored lipoprotein)